VGLAVPACSLDSPDGSDCSRFLNAYEEWESGTNHGASSIRNKTGSTAWY
jgi:hypothetical protein